MLLAQKSLPALDNKLLVFLYKLDLRQLLEEKVPRSLTVFSGFEEVLLSICLLRVNY